MGKPFYLTTLFMRTVLISFIILVLLPEVHGGDDALIPGPEAQPDRASEAGEASDGDLIWVGTRATSQTSFYPGTMSCQICGKSSFKLTEPLFLLPGSEYHRSSRAHQCDKMFSKRKYLLWDRLYSSIHLF